MPELMPIKEDVDIFVYVIRDRSTWLYHMGSNRWTASLEKAKKYAKKHFATNAIKYHRSLSAKQTCAVLAYKLVEV